MGVCFFKQAKPGSCSGIFIAYRYYVQIVNLKLAGQMTKTDPA